MKKQILSLLIAIMMLLGMLPISATAIDTVISEIVFELEEMPAPGVTLDFPSVVSVNGSEDNINLISIDENDWYFSDEYTLVNPEVQPFEGDTFLNGYAYDLYLKLVPEVGYQIAPDCTFTLKMPDYEQEKGYIYIQTSGYTGVDFYFNLTGVQPEINSILLELDHAPEAGGDPDALVPTILSVDGDPLSAHLIEIFNISWYWYDTVSDAYLVEDGSFQEGVEYQLNADIYAAGDYVFSDDISFSVQVGDDARVGFVDEVWTPWNYLFCLDFPVGEDTPIESVTLATEELPMAGNTPFEFSVYSVNGDPREVGTVEFTNGWGIYDETEGLYWANGLIPFEAGEKYAATIFLAPAEGYTFTDDCTVTVLGPDGNLAFECDYVHPDEITGLVPFATLPSLTTIESITIGTNQTPAAGATPFTFTVYDVNGGPLIGAVELSNGWGIWDATEELYLPNGLIPFEAGETYTATIFLEPADGYAFAPDCDVTVMGPNGELPFNCDYVDRSEIYGDVPYGVIPAPKTFNDVKETDFYKAPVDWAVSRNITSGTSDTTVSPHANCLRAQVATFLWRAAGCPEPQSNVNPFVDVKTTDYFYKAVLWAAEAGITTGTDATHFSPYAVCNRSQIVTFLWRFADCPEIPHGYSSFVDVSSADYFYKAVLWAGDQGITTGVDATHFAPFANCSRSQTVTFLYRLLG